MKVTGTLINYYFHCKRQCYLFGNKLNLENNSEDVMIGRVLHELKNDGKKNTEIAIENIKIDKITEDYVVEIKKSDADINAAKWQLLFYLYTLKQKGILKKGKIVVVEKKKDNKKTHYVELDEDSENEILKLQKDIINLLESDSIPDVINKPTCKKCAYYEYCYI
ncbi:CRISPR-associated protein Cas4 [Vallitalea maricola]|uniref:CRISPR-associated protein Cas4 n=1 Tax=Vallitalea maricola TaxID=3074433 RepID=A0ACB5UGV0_9FIRM|nr:CRISPR-associated protein Cas4 [Vallitalea sp. AN17-2]